MADEIHAVDLSKFPQPREAGCVLEHCPHCRGSGARYGYQPIPERTCVDCGAKLTVLHFMHEPWHTCVLCSVRKKVLDFLKAVLPAGGSVLDVGAGMGRYHKAVLDAGYKLTLLDAYRPYLEKADPRASLIQGTTQEVLPRLRESAFGAVLCLDHVEHLIKQEAAEAIGEMQRISAYNALIFTPQGLMPQDTDGYGMGGDVWQTHRSAWSAEDLKALGFAKVEVWPDFHRVQDENGIRFVPVLWAG